ncbi:MAG: hypothetical protein E6I25_06210 [Chloroflexi bacterium]|nr:MAG: hypothetical protein E6I25_06210 [Chloroflexota bacterium]
MSSSVAFSLSAGVIVLIAVIALWVGQGSIHPKLTRQQAIQAAMKWGDHSPYPRVEAKYMRYSDLVAGGEAISGGSDYFVWVVAVSGQYAISPLGCTTWGIAIVTDEWVSTGSPVFEGGISGVWPPFFDGLPDRAKN